MRVATFKKRSQTKPKPAGIAMQGRLIRFSSVFSPGYFLHEVISIITRWTEIFSVEIALSPHKGLGPVFPQYDTIRQIYVRLKADQIASLI